MLQPDSARWFQRLDREIWIITSAAGERQGGLVATTIASASIVPEMPRLTVTIARQHATWELIERSQSFAAHLVASDRIDLAQRFGMQSGRDAEKLSGLGWSRGGTGAPLLKDAAAWLECRVEASWDTGDRTLYLAEVVGSQPLADGEIPLTMHGLLARADEEMKGELRRHLEADARLDAEQIRIWRALRSQS